MQKGNFDNLISGDQLVLIDFHALWCGPCKVLKPILEEVKQAEGDKVRIIKIDIDKNPNLARRFNVSGVPTLMLFKNGNSVWRQSGVMPAKQISQAIQANS